MEILLLIQPPSCIGDNTLALPIIYTLVELPRQYGNCLPAIFGYAMYGALVCWLIPDIELAYKLTQVALSLLPQLNARQLKAKIYILSAIISQPKKEHIKETREPLYNSIASALEVGDIEYACHGVIFYCEHLFHLGEHLEYIKEQQSEYIKMVRKFKQEHQLYLTQICAQVVLNLLYCSQDKCRLMGEMFNEAEIIPRCQEVNNAIALFNIYCAKSLLCYLFKDYYESIINSKEASKYQGFVQGQLIFVQYNFYYSLALLAECRTSKIRQLEYLQQVEENQKKLKYWATYAPMNYLHKFQLVEAEKARILGEIEKALSLYEQAIIGAREQGYLQEEALANELAGEFHLARGQQNLARFYLLEAYYGYIRWGAIAKVKDLESRYPEFFARLASQANEYISPIISTIDWLTVFKASQAISEEIVLSKLLSKLMRITLENAGAQKGLLILCRNNEIRLEASGTVDSNGVIAVESVPMQNTQELPMSVINYVRRTQENIILKDATCEGLFTLDPYIKNRVIKSLLCIPIIHQGKLTGILYLENNLTVGAFTSDRLQILQFLSSQAAISLENCRLYEQLGDYSHNLEKKVADRTYELQQKNQELQITLQQLRTTQEQIIAQEKLVSLGCLTAGIAHELKNPLNFVTNFAEISVELMEELLEEIENQKEKLDLQPRENIEEIVSNLQQNAQKIKEHGKRADRIIREMLMHSRRDKQERQLVDINALLAESIYLADRGMRSKDSSFKIFIKTQYDRQLEPINIFRHDLNRVFLNIINNACYAVNQKKEENVEEFFPRLIVSTKDLGDRVEIRFRDNGKGIPSDLINRIFEPFFTTKPPGEGTGLGLSISYDVIVKEHQGNITVKSKVGTYTEFIITIPKFIES